MTVPARPTPLFADIADVSRRLAEKEMVTAAAQLVSSANGAGGAGPGQQRYREELAGATDRLVAWAQAFDELGGLPRR